MKRYYEEFKRDRLEDQRPKAQFHDNFIYLFIMSYLPRSTPSVRSTVLPGAPALHACQNKHQSAYIQL